MMQRLNTQLLASMKQATALVGRWYFGKVGYLLEAGYQEGLYITALQQNLMSQAPYVLQLLCFQPVGQKAFILLYVVCIHHCCAEHLMP